MNKWLRRLAIAVLGVTIVMALLVTWWGLGERGRIHDAAVSSAHLASIPDPEYQARTVGNLFSRSYWISFECSEAGFSRFVADSSGLRSVTPYVFPFSHSNPTPTTWDRPAEYMRDVMKDAEHFWFSDVSALGLADDFWDTSMNRARGRRFEIVHPSEQIHGFLLRDDDTGEVLLCVRYS